MADRKKRTRHTKLVVPGVESKKDKNKKAKAAKAAQQAPAKPEAAAATAALPRPTGPTDAVRGREENPRIQLKRRKRRGRRLRLLAGALGIVLLVGLYFSGAYMFMVVKGQELLEGARVGLQSGEGFPIAFEIPGYKDVQPVGTSAFAVLGEKDMAVVSASGKELYRVQHGYASPAITTGDTRVCIYNRDGTSYTIEGRDRRLQSYTSDQSILLCEMSPGGNLAVVTYSRYRFTLKVYDYVMSEEPLISVPYVDEYPYMVSFLSDDKHFALAAMYIEGGAARTTIQLLHTSRGSVQGTIDGGEAVALRIEYLSANRIMVIYDSYTALYDSKGKELARYEYDGRELYTADTTGSVTALVFRPVSHNQLVTVLLDGGLNQTAEVTTESSDSPQVLVSGKNVLLMAGYYVYAYSSTGAQLASYEADAIGYGLAAVREPLLVSSGSISPLSWMLRGGSPPGSSTTSLPQEETTSLAGEGTSLPAEGAEPPQEPTSLPEDDVPATSLPPEDGAGE